jgi:hypothetical protein
MQSQGAPIDKYIQLQVFYNYVVVYCYFDELIYSLRPILLFANIDVSITKMCLDISKLAKSLMGRRKYSKLYVAIMFSISLDFAEASTARKCLSSSVRL